MPRNPRLVLIEPSGSRREVEVTRTPFKMGRQAENDLPLRDSRVSRQHAQIICENGKYFLEDLGSRHGTFVNKQQVTRHELKPQDTIEFGVPESYSVIFSGEESTLGDLLERVESPAPATSSSRELYHLGVLLEVARALHGSLTLEDVLISVLDAAIQVTHTERGVLLLRNKAGVLDVTVARSGQGTTLRPGDVEISSSVLRQVTTSRNELIVGDVEGDAQVRQQASVVRLALHTVVAIPLEKRPMVHSLDSTVYAQQPELLGVLYLDSHSPSTAFSELDRQVLRSLAAEAATVVENARLFAAARAQERLEHELEIASEIQQRMLPKTFPQGRYVAVTGKNIACQSVGGDCYDVLELPGDRYGFVVGDVAGKGISASLLASVLQGVFAATASLGTPMKDVTSRVNRFLCERSGDERFATLFYGVLSPDGALEYINAGHVTPLIHRPSGELVPLASENFPLGMFDFAEYQSGNVKLNPGDYLVIYTDGISEAANPRGDLFEESRLRLALQKFKGQTVEELLEAIQAAVRVFTENAAQADDITLLIVQYRGPSA